jgi:hypothetical protein
MIYGLGHPRCGTGFTASLLNLNGVDVGHERIRSEGIVSWEIASLRSQLPWGDGVTEFLPDSKIFLVARSPLAALNSVLIECLQTRSIGFRAAVIFEQTGVEIFAESEQRTPEIQHDYMSWSVLSLIHWYEICFSRKPEMIFRVDEERDDVALSEYLGRTIDRDGKSVHRNHKPFELNGYPIGDLSDQGFERLTKLRDLCEKLGYPKDVKVLETLTRKSIF